MPSTIGKGKIIRIKYITLLEGKIFLRNKNEIAFFEKKCTFFGRKKKKRTQRRAVGSGVFSLARPTTTKKKTKKKLKNVSNIAQQQ